MISEKQRYCIACGSEIKWDEITTPSFFDPVNGLPRFYIRGECPERRLMTNRGHAFGLVSEILPNADYPIPFGIMDDHPAIPAYVAKQEAADGKEA